MNLNLKNLSNEELINSNDQIKNVISFLDKEIKNSEDNLSKEND